MADLETATPDAEALAPTEAVVDETLIIEMLRLTPLERLQQNDRMLKTIGALRSAFDAHDRRQGNAP